MSRDTLFLSVDAKLRLRIETTIERLIDLLDSMEGDDLEPLGSGEAVIWNGIGVPQEGPNWNQCGY